MLQKSVKIDLVLVLTTIQKISEFCTYFALKTEQIFFMTSLYLPLHHANIRQRSDQSRFLAIALS